MTHLQSCEAVCPDNVKVEGSIKCMSGRLVDASHCLSSAGLVTEVVTKVVGTFDVELTGVPTVASLTAAVAGAFAVDQQYVFVTFSTATAGTGGRLLSALRSAPLRFLASKINIDYEVTVPPNTTKTEAEVVTAAQALSEPQSAAGQAFSQSMLDSGVLVVSVDSVKDPITVQSIVVRDETGAVVKPIQATTTDAPLPSEGSDINVAAVVGGVVAGLTLLVLLGGLVHYFMLRRKVDDSDDDVISTLAV